jgi:hypothetical protein
VSPEKVQEEITQERVHSEHSKLKYCSGYDQHHHDYEINSKIEKIVHDPEKTSI